MIEKIKSNPYSNSLKQLTLLLLAASISFFVLKLILSGQNKAATITNTKKSEREQSFEQSLKNILEVNQNRSINLTVRDLKSLNSDKLTDLQKREIYLAIAKTVEKYCENYECDEITNNLILKYYQHAYTHSQLPEDKKAINRKLATILIKEKKWHEASKIFKETESYLLPPEERWKTKLLWAQCLENDKNENEAVNLLTQITEESDIEDIWAVAMRKKADLLFSISTDEEKLNKHFEKTKSDNKRDPGILRSQASKLYTQLLDELSPLHIERFRALIGQIRYHGFNQEYEAAYRLANKLHSSSAPKEEKIKCLETLAAMEENDGNFETAASMLQLALERFSDENISASLFGRLYNLLIGQKEWSKAFSIAERLAVKAKDPAMAMQILNDLYPDRQNLLSNLILSKNKFNYLDRAQAMVDTLNEAELRNWTDIKNAAKFVTAVLTFHSEKFNEAEKLFTDYIIHAPDTINFEAIYYLDFLTSQSLNKPPVIIALKAKRYLTVYADNKHNEEVLMALLNAYYEMGLYKEALNIAKKSFVKELVNMGDSGQFASNEQSLSHRVNHDHKGSIRTFGYLINSMPF